MALGLPPVLPAGIPLVVGQLISVHWYEFIFNQAKAISARFNGVDVTTDDLRTDVDAATAANVATQAEVDAIEAALAAEPKTLTTVGGATYTVAAADRDLIFSGACTVTLPTATANGRELWLKNTSANAVISASSNVVPLAGGAAGTAILAASAGRFVRLVPDGTNWIILAGN
jgi:hypothetical protein